MLSINPSELIWTIVCFLALYFLLKRFLFGPLVRFMDERQARIDEGLNEEKQAKSALEEDARLLAEARQENMNEARQLIMAGKSRDEQRHAEALREARDAAAEASRRGMDEAEALRGDTARQLSERRDELAECLASRLLKAGNTEQ